MNKQLNKKETFNLRAFGSDVLVYSLGQITLLFFGLVQSLIIPKYLSTADYGYWQLFLLCTTYVGLLHFGFLSGLLIRWAGKDLKSFLEEIPTAFRITILEQVLVVTLLIPIVITTHLLPKGIVFSVLLNAILVNLLTFFMVISQSLKHFKIITKANIINGFMFLLAVLIIFFYSFQGYILLIVATLFINLILVLIFTFHYRDYLFQKNSRKRPIFQYTKENIGIGIFVLLGNFAALIFTTIDRVTISSFFPITQFAVYTFAMNMCGFVTVFLQAVAQVFLPYLSGSGTEARTKAYDLLRPALVIFWAGLLAAYFPFSVWIRYYLPRYSSSLSLMALLLCTIGFSGQINILHANFFKVYRKQRTYFLLAGTSLLMAGVLNLFAASIFRTLNSIAATAVVNFSLWYFLNEVALRHFVAGSIKEIAKWAFIIGIYVGAFLGTYALDQTWIIGFCIYSVLFVGITVVCLHKEMDQLWNIIIQVI